MFRRREEGQHEHQVRSVHTCVRSNNLHYYVGEHIPPGEFTGRREGQGDRRIEVRAGDRTE